jgi:hypothetical protein
MEEQAQTMKEVVGRFNLGEEVAPVTRQAAPAKAIATAKRPAPAIARTPAQELATKAKPKTLPKKANKASEEWEEF